MSAELRSEKDRVMERVVMLCMTLGLITFCGICYCLFTNRPWQAIVAGLFTIVFLVLGSVAAPEYLHERTTL